MSIQLGNAWILATGSPFDNPSQSSQPSGWTLTRLRGPVNGVTCEVWTITRPALEGTPSQQKLDDLAADIVWLKQQWEAYLDSGWDYVNGLLHGAKYGNQLWIRFGEEHEQVGETGNATAGVAYCAQANSVSNANAAYAQLAADVQ